MIRHRCCGLFDGQDWGSSWESIKAWFLCDAKLDLSGKLHLHWDSTEDPVVL